MAIQKNIYVVNPQETNSKKLHITKDMAGGFGFNAGIKTILPPLELIYHALVLRDKEYDINFFDLQAESEKTNSFFEGIKEKNNLVFLILVSTPTLENDLTFIRKIRECTSAPKIFVKFNLKNKEVIEKILETKLVEKVLFGETENIIDKIFEGESEGGTAWLKNNQIIYGSDLIIENLNDLPYLDADFVNFSAYSYPLLPTPSGNFFTFQSSRGCPFTCSYYCPYPLIQGKKWRAMSAEKLYKNMEILVKKYGVSTVLFRDATFTLDKTKIIDFCDNVFKNQLGLNWWCESRINCLDEEILEKMSQAGCVGINLGVETGDDALMRKQGKVGADIEQLEKIRNLAKKFNIKMHFLMIVGLPDETKKTLYQSLLLIEKLKPESLGITTITPYPGTPLYQEAVANNWIVNKNVNEYIGNRVVMRTKYLSPRQIRKGNVMLQLIGHFSRKKNLAGLGKLLKLYFWLWSKI